MPTETGCPDTPVLEAFLLGRLSPVEGERLAAHVERCAHCIAACEQLQTRDLLLEAMESPPAEWGPPPEEVTAALAERLRALRPLQGTTDTHQSGGLLARAVEEVSDTTQENYDFLAPPEGPDEIGRLGPYRVRKVLGIGGMGIVFLAEDPQLGRPVALKTMKPVMAASASARRRFLREARAIAGVVHDHVVAILHVGEDRGVPFLAMPFLQGETLGDRLGREGTLPTVEILRIGREIADGLAAAHALGVIHRDIKPANVWLEAGSGRVKLLDFGVARGVGADARLTQSGIIVGTPAYMAPEQARGEELDARCDLFSLGCVLYQCCTGRQPFPGEHALAALRSLELHRPKSPRALNPRVPAPLSDLILRLLAKAPEHRPSSAQEVNRALEAIHAGRARPRASYRRRAALIAAAVVMGLALSSFWWLPGWFRSDANLPGNSNPAPETAPLFAPAVALESGLYPGFVATADFDGDGKLDLVVTNLHRHAVSVLLGNGDGSFRTLPPCDVGDWFAHSVAVGDFNRDGKPDLVVTGPGQNVVAVLLGKGDGTFQPPVQYPVRADPRHAVVGDFNNDGRLDLAVANVDGSVSVLLGNGDGTFRDAVHHRAGKGAGFLAVADFNGDGKLDLAEGDSSAAHVNVLLGRGDGTFDEPVPYGITTGSGVFAVAVGDFNGDGKPDLVTASARGGVSILLGKGDGTFHDHVDYVADQSAQALVVADFDGDGKLDVAFSHWNGQEVTVLLGNGDGTLRQPHSYGVGESPQFLAVGDFNGDGAPDLAVPNLRSNNVSLLLNQPPARYRHAFEAAAAVATGAEPRGIAAADFNRDGRLDLVTADAGADSVSVLLGNGDATFHKTASPKTGKKPVSVAVADFNHDGKPDLAVANSGDDTVSILLGNGDGRFRQQVPRSVGKKPVSIAVGDFNRDGNPDLVTADFDEGTVSVLLGNGDGTFRPAVKVPVRERANVVAVGDFNRDGKLDLAVAHRFYLGRVSVLLGNGDGTFQRPVSYPVGAHPEAIVVGDFNGDGKPDLVAVNWGTFDGNLLAGRGDGTFRTAVNFPVGPNPSSAAAGDFNRDGKLDLVATLRNSNQVVGLFGEGKGSLADSIGHHVGSYPMAVVVGDFDGDGQLDLAVANSRSGSVSILLNRPSAPRLEVEVGAGGITMAGRTFAFRLSAWDALGRPDPTFTGTVHFASSDVRAELPADCTFSAADRGQRDFHAVFRTPGAHTITASDLGGVLRPESFSVRVLTLDDVHLRIIAPAEATAGVPFSVTVEAIDPYDEFVPHYVGRVRFTCTDSTAALPAEYTFREEDGRLRIFKEGVVLRNPGVWTITATDTTMPSITGSAKITIKAAR
jgi:hypothetical protein